MNKENLKAAREKERNRREGGKEVPRVVEHPVKMIQEKNMDGVTYKANSNSWAGGKNYKASVADGVRTREIFR